MIRIVIFGVGKAFLNRIDFFVQNSETVEIVAFIDNDDKYHNKKMCNVPIYHPNELKTLDFDFIVILSNKFYAEMEIQLIGLGVKKSLIWDFYSIKRYVLKGKKTLYGTDINPQSEKEKVLIISTEMGFNGGTMVAVYAAQALTEMGKEVVLATPEIVPRLLDEIVDAKLSITIWESLPYICEEDIDWIDRFDTVIINVFQMMNCAYEISKRKPVLWWIHENRSIWGSFYQDTQKAFENIDTSGWMNRLNIAGVSGIAMEAFNHFYPNIMKRTLPFGIPDKLVCAENKIIKNRETIVFAVIAGFAEFKGQQVLVNALKKLPDAERKQVEVWFIGPSGKNIEDLKEICDDQKNMKFLGLLSHEKVIATLPDIDVIVCPSLIETMSMSTVEGMMFHKLCIASDMTGIAEFIEDGKNGFVFKVGNADDLAKKISWIINNRDQWESIQTAARKTFEEVFSLEKFGKRLVEELEEAKNIYERKSNR